jgi:arsenate reductase
MNPMKRVLFLCTGNSARSQMAEGWAKYLGSGVAEFYSAGTLPSREVNPHALAAMREMGVDISGHSPKSFTSIPKPLDLIVAVCGQAAEKCPRPEGAIIEAWNLPDPAAFEGSEHETMNVFRESRDDIEKRVRDLLMRL